VSLIILLIWGLSFVDWRALWVIVAANFGLLAFLPPAVNVMFSAIIYAEIIGCIVNLMLIRKKKHEPWGERLKLLKRWTKVCAGLFIIILLGWGLYVVSDLVGQILAIVIFLVLVMIIVIALGRIMKDMAPLLVVLRRPMGYASYSSEMWKEDFRKLDPSFQATFMRRTTPEVLGLTVNGFLELLQEVERDVKKEPALSAYWAKRYQIELIIRQDRIG
jgi:hypothetical protein